MAGAARQLDRFEQEKADFHERVRNAYLSRAAQMPARVRVIDSRQKLEYIQKELEKTRVFNILKGARGKSALAIGKYLDTVGAIQKLVLLYQLKSTAFLEASEGPLRRYW